MNSSDPKIRGRMNGMATRGETKGTAKLKTQDVLEIRASQERTQALAERFHVNPRHIRAVRRREWWKHV